MSEYLAGTLPEHLQIATSDPLELDGVLRELPQHNEISDIHWLLATANMAVEKVVLLDAPDRTVATASLRDLDFIAGSLLRHGSDPFADVSGLEAAMISMGSAADTVPRGTIATYAAANPTGDR